MITHTRSGLVLLLLAVFLANLGETYLETSRRSSAPLAEADYKGAYAVQEFERALVSFDFHDRTEKWAVYAYSISYFILFPVLALALLVALARREEIAPLRVCCLAVCFAYLVSLPFFLLFPVPERWAYPGSNAVLLSDQWSSLLIDSIRPISGINNSFPSTHVSLTVIMVAVCWLFQVRLRSTVTALGMAVVVATFALGIHWLADIVAGIAVGLLSVALAWRCTDTTERPLLLESPSAMVHGRRRRIDRLATATGSPL